MNMLSKGYLGSLDYISTFGEQVEDNVQVVVKVDPFVDLKYTQLSLLIIRILIQGLYIVCIVST